ncbi:MAG TPA: GNAT family N-acetyltransferase, partial [Mycobacterium sp.]|nr:GNAT family N-acetyltransferase [Mycobacterium sp.]
MGPVRIARLTEAEWEVFAGLRLRALAEAFGRQDEQYLSEHRFTRQQWCRRLCEHAQFAARLAGRPVGLIGAHRETADTIYLYSLWLDPS